MTFDERRLEAGIKAGDPQAFRDLYDAYGARVLGYALRLTACREEAEDLLQDTFVACFSGRSSFHGRSRLISWLLGIATRRWRDRGRRHVLQTVPLDDRPNGPGIERGVVDALSLSQALGRLEPPFREALLLVRSQGLTYEEAAAIVGEPVGTVKWRVHEAARRTQQFLNEMDGESDEVQRKPAAEDRSACRR
jgi:RNA polymerase sigma-70 factor (ECF subfamily)